MDWGEKASAAVATSSKSAERDMIIVSKRVGWSLTNKERRKATRVVDLWFLEAPLVAVDVAAFLRSSW
jgi:hypothetical protein